MPYTDWPDIRNVPEDELMLTTEEIADSRRAGSAAWMRK